VTKKKTKIPRKLTEAEECFFIDPAYERWLRKTMSEWEESAAAYWEKLHEASVLSRLYTNSLDVYLRVKKQMKEQKQKQKQKKERKGNAAN
jgi:hypothetical protein